MIDTGKFDCLKKILEERILVLDGAMGSLIQCRCADHSHNEKDEAKLPDILVRENPELIKDIHTQYLEAGADIIETDSFNCNRFSLADYGLENEAYALAKEAALLAREAVEDYMKDHTGQPRFVAGSIGPTKYMLSLSEEGSDLNFDSYAEAYKEQISGLLDGGVDIILLETVFDTLTVKAALYAVSKLEEERNEKIPVMISATVANSTGRLLSGQTIEAFYASVAHGNLISVGLNCGFGSADVLPYLRRIADIAETAVSVYPNAGLPDDCGEYTEDWETFTRNLKPCLEEGLVNIIGGCCGTTPAHIRALAEMAKHYPPRKIPGRKHSLVLSNMEISRLGDSKELIQVGERTNVAGSAKFARLIREKNFEEALEIAARQIESGASIIDVCMDDGMEDAAGNMLKFLKHVNENPDTAGVPVMIDSSDWEVIEQALKICQGKSIVNSISLKDGEAEFLRRGREIRRLGASAVVMLFDEKGQAESFERKCEIAQRSYNLLLNDGFEPSDIIFDPNVLTVGTGLKERDPLALDFIKATRWIKENLPHVSVSGGISNLSFAFRGNNPLRQAMHTVFLYHAGKAGLDMAIVNAGMLSLYEDIDPALLELLEDLILSRRDDAVSRLVVYAQDMKSDQAGTEKPDEKNVSELSLSDKIEEALTKGKSSEIESLVEEAVKQTPAMDIIDNLLMPVMKKIGEKFGEGRMFLPQVIKSAQAMKKAIVTLQPYLDNASQDSNNEKVIIATVKGDVHDIGKNIVSLVISCNGYDVTDLGVRVEAETIADKAEQLNPKAILLSGLISPSLNEMTVVCKELERRGLRIPVIIGGAATSEMHTAVKIAPEYSGDVYYSSDASENLRILNSLSENSSEENRQRQKELRDMYVSRQEKISSLAPSAAGKSKKKEINEVKVPSEIKKEVFIDFPIEYVEEFIDWNMLTTSLDIHRAGNKNIAEKEKTHTDVLNDALSLFEDLKNKDSLKLEGVVEIMEAEAPANDIILKRKGELVGSLPMIRAERGADAGRSVADFVASKNDYISLFAVSGGVGAETIFEEFINKGDYYSAFLVKLIADRLAEAFAQWLSKHLAKDVWGFNLDNSIRIAFGYPSAPDHTLKRDVFELLDVENLTHLQLTENSMIIPSESVCGIILSTGEYINVGKIGEKQQEVYASKRGISLSELHSLIPNNII